MWSSVALRGRAVPGIGPLRPFGLWYNRKTRSRTLRGRGLYLLASGLGQPGICRCSALRLALHMPRRPTGSVRPRASRKGIIYFTLGKLTGGLSSAS